jgi:hypothetical protein
VIGQGRGEGLDDRYFGFKNSDSVCIGRIEGIAIYVAIKNITWD